MTFFFARGTSSQAERSHGVRGTSETEETGSSTKQGSRPKLPKSTATSEVLDLSSSHEQHISSAGGLAKSNTHSGHSMVGDEEQPLLSKLCEGGSGTG